MFILCITGCGATDDADHAASTINVPVYARRVSQINLQEEYNPYIMEFSENGIFYCVQKEEQQKEGEEYIDGYQFFYQTYDGSEVKTPLCELKDGYIRDITSIRRESKDDLVVLWMDEDAHILEYDENGKLYRDVVIDQLFNSFEDFPILLALHSGEYVIHMGKEIYLLDSDGIIKSSLEVDGNVDGLLCTDDGNSYVIYEKNENNHLTVWISEMDFTKKRLTKSRCVPGNMANVSVFEGNKFISFSEEYAFLFEMDESKEEPLVDLKKQSILFSQIKRVLGNRDEIRLATLDMTDPDQDIYLISLIKDGEEPTETTAQEQYTPDGRKIVRIAVPEDYKWQIEYQAQKYNQKSDICYVEVDRFTGTLQDYLGRGERPDAVMLNDHTEIAPLVERNLLTDFLPLFDAQDKYAVSEIIPKAKELLGHGEGMYAMTGIFEMLLRVSTGEEYDDSGKCSAAEYIKWYDEYLNNNEIAGIGSLENILYADITSYYDEKTGDVFFTSSEFKELMMTYKELLERHKGELDQSLRKDRGWVVDGIVRGPYGYTGLLNAMVLTDPGVELVGMPLSNGESSVLVTLPYPIGIMSTSEYKAEAFDFIMYYSRTKLIYEGDNAADYERGELYQTPARFSTYTDVLNEEIYETEKPFAAERGVNGAINFFYFTDAHKEQLTYLMENANSDTKTQRDIFGFFSEEMGGYLQGNKNLDDACEALQNRTSLYLAE